ncbi:MAG TPA: PQQ-binding-like beta-propeller repeat protein [Solirubrobacteraceae bacterium]|nr:PQQ-binding-like beta-propeller repeat protein [Solirubrobacteraceae bacterium]
MSLRHLRSLLPASKRAKIALAASVALLTLAIGLGAYVYEQHRTGSIYHPNAPFTPQPVAPQPPKKPPKTFAWPLYGYTKNHTRYFAASPRLRPPFRKLWVHTGGALLEFPPVLYGNRLFQLSDDATLHAIDKYTGKDVWSRRLGALSASTPAVSSNTVYVTVLERSRGARAGRVVALNSANGHFRWQRDLPSRAESSPLLDDGMLIFGSENGTVYALNARTGRPLWTYHAAGAVKASPSASGGALYFGDYSGQIQAISERTGRRIWRSGSGGALLGSGTFYSSAAVVYGRVFLGNTDGRVYAYDAKSGKLDWAVQTGAYVYSSPAVANAPGLGPTIYSGSYDGSFRAINARSGRVEWKYKAGGKISGSATVIGNIVYFSDLGTHTTYGLGISTGRVAFHEDTGAFDPVISDGHNIYMSGYSALFALAPLSMQPSHATAAPAAVGRRSQIKSSRSRHQAPARARRPSSHARRRRS